jgi:hypothetical protein
MSSTSSAYSYLSPNLFTKTPLILATSSMLLDKDLKTYAKIDLGDLPSAFLGYNDRETSHLGHSEITAAAAITVPEEVTTDLLV